MLCLDQRGDDLCDSLGHLRLVSVEVYSECSPLDPFHGGAIDQHQLRVSRHKNLKASVIPTETGAFPIM